MQVCFKNHPSDLKESAESGEQRTKNRNGRKHEVSWVGKGGGICKGRDCCGREARGMRSALKGWRYWQMKQRMDSWMPKNSCWIWQLGSYCWLQWSQFCLGCGGRNHLQVLKRENDYVEQSHVCPFKEFAWESQRRVGLWLEGALGSRQDCLVILHLFM